VVEKTLTVTTRELSELRTAVDEVGGALGVPPVEENGTTSATARIRRIGGRVHMMAREGIRFRMRHLFAIVCTHYENFDVATVAAEGFLLESTAEERAKLEARGTVRCSSGRWD